MPARRESSASSVTALPLGRRSFVKGLSTLGLGWALGLSEISAVRAFSPRRYTLVGEGERSRIYLEAILSRYRRVAELVDEVCPSEVQPEDFQRRLTQKTSDTVIVAASGDLACNYLVPALHAGCDVIMELAAIATGEACTAILDAGKRAGRVVRVALPHRYHSANTDVKRVLASGEIGELLSVDFTGWCDQREDLLRGDSLKGISERQLERFDLLNWWIGAAPLSVRSIDRRAHGKADTPAVWVSYGDGVTLSYSEKHCRAADGYKVAFNGTKGRLEHRRVIASDRFDDAVAGPVSFFGAGTQTRLLPLRGPARAWEAESDARPVVEARMLAELFSVKAPLQNYDRSGEGRSAACALAILHGSRAAT